jgi:hypothetical protein
VKFLIIRRRFEGNIKNLFLGLECEVGNWIRSDQSLASLLRI